MDRACRIIALLPLCALPAFAISLQAQPAAHWSLREELRIGSLNDAATAFGNIGAVRIGPQNRIYIAEPLQQQLRVFDSTGRPAGVIGRKGRGPGEFESITEMGFLGDTTYVLDALLRRISWFTATGEFIGSLQVTLSPFPRALFPDGTGAVFTGSTREQKTRWVRVDRRGVVRDTLATYDRYLPPPASTLGYINGVPQYAGAPLHAHSAHGSYEHHADQRLHRAGNAQSGRQADGETCRGEQHPAHPEQHVLMHHLLLIRRGGTVAGTSVSSIGSAAVPVHPEREYGPVRGKYAVAGIPHLERRFETVTVEFHAFEV